MPAPIIIAAGAVVFTAVRAIIGRAITFIMSRWGQVAIAFLTLSFENIKDQFLEWWASEDTRAYVLAQLSPVIASWAETQLGITLDPDNPMSKESMSNAVSLKVGVTLTNIFDRDALCADLGVYLAQRVNTATGMTLTTLWPPESIPNELGREATVALQNSMQSEPSWLPVHVRDSMITAVRTFDGVIQAHAAEPDKITRQKMLNRLRQRKYALTHRRVGGVWELRD